VALANVRISKDLPMTEQSTLFGANNYGEFEDITFWKGYEWSVAEEEYYTVSLSGRTTVTTPDYVVLFDQTRGYCM
jgi:hypothetical protein